MGAQRDVKAEGELDQWERVVWSGDVNAVYKERSGVSPTGVSVEEQTVELI